MKKYNLIYCSLLPVAALISSHAGAAEEIGERVKNLESQLTELKSQLKNEIESEQELKIGGALRFNYSYADYDEDQKERQGDLDFDLFRLNVDGRKGDFYYSAEYRWYQYMDVIHHLYLGYDLDDKQTLQLGLTQVPFGNLKWASHNFFFTSGFYLGLEDDYDMGVNYRYRGERLDLDVAFYKNDEQGGVDGYVGNRTDRYSYDVVGIRLEGEDTGDDPSKDTELGESNTLNLRVAYDVIQQNDLNVEVGLSGQWGGLEGKSGSMGTHSAWAVHSVASYQRWELQLQYAGYEYELDDYDATAMVVGAYAFYDDIPTEADTYNVNLAYTLPVDWGMVDSLTFYNDYSAVTNKSTQTKDTRFNATGVMASIGSLYVYVDYYIATNQAFLNGSLVGDSSEQQKRLNVNLGYYF